MPEVATTPRVAAAVDIATCPVDQVYEQLRSREEGLTAQEASERLAAAGANVHLMIPFVLAVWVLERRLELVDSSKLVHDR